MPKYHNTIKGNIRAHVQGEGATINIINGRVSVPCEAFVEGCKNPARHTVNGYHLCTRCAQKYAGYTPEVDRNLVGE
jgi:hypothetical protein